MCPTQKKGFDKSVCFLKSGVYYIVKGDSNFLTKRVNLKGHFQMKANVQEFPAILFIKLSRVVLFFDSEGELQMTANVQDFPLLLFISLLKLVLTFESVDEFHTSNYSTESNFSWCCSLLILSHTAIALMHTYVRQVNTIHHHQASLSKHETAKFVVNKFQKQQS